MNLEKRDLNQLTFINIKGGIRRLLNPVPHGGSGMNTGGAHKLKTVNGLRAHEMSGLKEPGDLFWTLTRQETQGEIFDKFFLKKNVVVRSFTADSNLLQPMGGENRNTLTRHIFSCFTAHISTSQVTLALGVLRARHPCIIRMLLLS